jgi:hypothetical protein
MTRRLLLAAFCCVSWAVTCYAQTTAIRPDQISPKTPDITWGPGGSGYQVGTTVAWRTDNTATPVICQAAGTPAGCTASDLATVVELTFNGAIGPVTVPAATGTLGDGAGFAIQVGPGTLTLNCASSCTAGAANSINGLTSIKIGPYQTVSLSSRSGKWYANMSVPQPAAQSGATALDDDMTWRAAPLTGGGGAPSGGCSASTNFFARVWALPATLDGPVPISGTAGPTNHLKAYDDMICGLVTDTVWARLDALWVPATNTATGTNTAVANLNLVAPSGCTTACYTLVPHGSPVFTANAGYTGGVDTTAATVWLDTGYNPRTVGAGGGQIAQNAAHAMAWSLTSSASSTYPATLGVSDNTTDIAIIPWATSGTFYGPMNDLVAASPYVGVSTALGSSLTLRFGPANTQVLLFRNGAQLGSVTAGSVSGAMPNQNVYLLANNNNGVLGAGGPYQVAAASIGGGLAATSPPAVSSSGGTTGTGLIPRICAFLTAVHGSC